MIISPNLCVPRFPSSLLLLIAHPHRSSSPLLLAASPHRSSSLPLPAPPRSPPSPPSSLLLLALLPPRCCSSLLRYTRSRSFENRLCCSRTPRATASLRRHSSAWTIVCRRIKGVCRSRRRRRSVASAASPAIALAASKATPATMGATRGVTSCTAT